MARFCYCSKIVPGKTEAIRSHWKNKPKNKSHERIAQEVSFWDHLQMTGFEAWLQPTPQGDYLIHCLEGESLQGIFKRLREQITAQQSVAVELHDFYQDVLGKDYKLPEAEPHIECLLDVTIPTSLPMVKKGFMYPLLPEKVQAHREFRAASAKNKEKHAASMQPFGVSRLSMWLQNTPKGVYSVVYTERTADSLKSAEQRLERGKHSPEWQDIAKTLMDHTGFNYNELSPEVEWLTEGCF